jgi:hypothetical protein
LQPQQQTQMEWPRCCPDAEDAAASAAAWAAKAGQDWCWLNGDGGSRGAGRMFFMFWRIHDLGS